MSIHEVMRDLYREVDGKVSITYTDPLLNNLTQYSSSGEAYGSSASYVNNGIFSLQRKSASLYECVLDGSYSPAAQGSNGWWSDVLSDANGEFVEDPWIMIEFISRPLITVSVHGDNARNIFPVDFTVELFTSIDSVLFPITGNDQVRRDIDVVGITDVIAMKITVHKMSKANVPAVILEVPISSTIHYEADNLMSISLLEELTYNDDVYMMGGVSANEITVLLNNESKEFYFDSGSLIAQYLKKNRKIVAWLGAEVNGVKEWYRLGTFWAYLWDVPVGAMTAKVVGFDTLGLLRAIKFYRHYVYQNESIGSLIQLVLDDAKSVYGELEYEIDAALYAINVPWAWFSYAGYLSALEKIANATHCQIYCDRDGKVIAKAKTFAPSTSVDTWDDSTNIIDKKYPTLYTESINTVDVTVTSVTIAEMQVVLYETPITISGTVRKLFTFSNSAVDNIQWDIDVSGSVTFDITEYGWGADITFYGTGFVNFVHCIANAILVDSNLIVTKDKPEAVAVNGSIPIDIHSDFIQTEERAAEIADIVLQYADDMRYRAEVTYRGNIAVSCNDTIRMTSGIAPSSDLYTLLRHELYWSGTLAGKAILNA